MTSFAPPKTQRLFEAIRELIQYAERSFGLVDDSVSGWVYLNRDISTRLDRVAAEGMALDQALELRTIDGRGEPLTGPHLQQSTMRDVLNRCEPCGANEVFLGNMAIVSLCTFWDQRTRKRIARALGIPVENVKSDLFEDLQLIHNAILHTRNLACHEIAHKTKVLHWFAFGDRIEVDREKLLQVVTQIQEFPNGLTTLGFDLGVALDRPEGRRHGLPSPRHATPSPETSFMSGPASYSCPPQHACAPTTDDAHARNRALR